MARFDQYRSEEGPPMITPRPGNQNFDQYRNEEGTVTGTSGGAAGSGLNSI